MKRLRDKMEVDFWWTFELNYRPLLVGLKEKVGHISSNIYWNFIHNI